MGRAEFSCNIATHLVTKELSFVMTYGVDALQPTNLALEGAIIWCSWAPSSREPKNTT